MPQGASLSEFGVQSLAITNGPGGKIPVCVLKYLCAELKKNDQKKKKNKQTRFGSSSSSLPVSLFFFLAGQFCLKSQQNTKLGSVFHTERPSYHEKLTSFSKARAANFQRLCY